LIIDGDILFIFNDLMYFKKEFLFFQYAHAGIAADALVQPHEKIQINYSRFLYMRLSQNRKMRQPYF